MFEAKTFEEPDYRSVPVNPYAANRALADSNGRQIVRLDPNTLVPHEYEIPQRDYTEQEMKAMRSVKIGLQCYYSGIYLVTFCFFVGGFLGRILGPQVVTIVSYGTSLGMLIVLLGEIRCLAIPREAGGFRHVMLSVLFYSMGITLSAIKFVLVAQGQGGPAIVSQIIVLQMLAWFLANFFFLTFIICLTRFMQNRPLYIKAVNTRRAIWSMVGFMFVVIFVVAILNNQLPQKNVQPLIFMVMGLGALGFIILVYSWLNRFTRLVQETCSAIRVEAPVLDYVD